MTKQQLENLKESGKRLMVSANRVEARWVCADDVESFKAAGYTDVSHLSDAATIGLGILESDL